MTEERIVRSILMSAALVLAVVGCPPEPPDEPDAGVGGSAPTGGMATGGVGTGGRASGGTSPVPVCQTVTKLPEQNGPCSNPAESQCLPNGDRCVCWRNAWQCNTRCAEFPQPTPGTDCSDYQRTACMYGNGVGCACGVDGRWICTGDSSSCPATPLYGEDCAQPGIVCDYPGPPHQICGCSPAADTGFPPSWACAVGGTCPDTQPAYPSPCTSMRICRYGNVLCTCGSGGNWLCDWPFMGLPTGY